MEALPKQLLVGYKHQCLEQFRDEQIKINEYKIAGLKEQLKVPHVEDQENNISYYTKLLKQRVTQNNIFDIKDHHGILHHDIEEKLNAFHHFNQMLYTEEHPDEQKNARKDLLRAIKQKRNNDNYQFPQELKDALNAKITEQEVLKALKAMPNNKSPGINGLTKEFFVYFWDLLKADFMDMLNEVENSKLGINQCMSLIRVLFKKGDKTLIKNYMPISLI